MTYSTHYHTEKRQYAAVCKANGIQGTATRICTSNPEEVTCKRCIVQLKKWGRI